MSAFIIFVLAAVSYVGIAASVEKIKWLAYGRTFPCHRVTLAEWIRK